MKETLQEREYASVPTEGKWFRVNPLEIDQNLFKEEKRGNISQEVTRLLILEAFEEMKKHSKYARPFKTMMPEKTWVSKTAGQLKELACKLGNHNSDWVEQALEWAQRIYNGETWEDICNKADTANWYRSVVWKNGFIRLVGGSYKANFSNPASYIANYDYNNYERITNFVIPLIVAYDV